MDSFNCDRASRPSSSTRPIKIGRSTSGLIWLGSCLIEASRDDQFEATNYNYILNNT